MKSFYYKAIILIIKLLSKIYDNQIYLHSAAPGDREFRREVRDFIEKFEKK